MQKVLWGLEIKQFKTFAVARNGECEFDLYFDFCCGEEWALPNPSVVDYRRTEIVAKFNVSYIGGGRVQEWYFLDFDFVCKTEGGQVRAPFFCRGMLSEVIKGF